MDMHKKLRRLRIERGLYQKEVADAVGLSRDAITKYETGERTPSRAALERLADFYEVPADYLLGRSVSDETTIAAEWATRWPLLSPEHREKAAKLAEMPGASIPSDATDDIIDILWAAVQTAITVTGAVTKKAAPKGGSLQEND